MAMTVQEAVEVLREFGLLTLGPQLSEAIDVICLHFDKRTQMASPAIGDGQ